MDTSVNQPESHSSSEGKGQANNTIKSPEITRGGGFGLKGIQLVQILAFGLFGGHYVLEERNKSKRIV